MTIVFGFFAHKKSEIFGLFNNFLYLNTPKKDSYQFKVWVLMQLYISGHIT